MFHFKVVKTIEEIKPYKEVWSSILERNANDNPFIEYEWITTWWTMLGNDELVEIYIVTTNKGEHVAFFPFVHTVRFGIHQFTFAGGDVSTYMDVISDAFWKEPSIEYMLDELIKLHKRVLFTLDGLLESKRTSQIIEKYTIKSQIPYSIFRVVTPYIDFTSIDIKKFSKKFKDIHRRENKLKALGPLTFQEVKENDLDEMFKLYDKRWQKKLDGSGFTENPKRHFFECIAAKKEQPFQVEINKLVFETKWIGFTFDIYCRGRKFCFRMAHDNDFYLFGPGRIIEKENMMQAYNRQYQLYDFGSGYEPYKMEWATHLDFTRKFIMSTTGKRERLLRFLKGMFTSFKSKVTSNRSYVELKRDRFGEFLYYIKKASIKEKFQKTKEVFNRIVYGNALYIYSLETSQQPCESCFQEQRIQHIDSHQQLAELISDSYKGFRYFSKDGKNIDYKRHDRFIRDESFQLLEELQPNSTYIKDFDEQLLPQIVKEMEREGLTIWTSANWFSFRKKKKLVTLGFKSRERIRHFRLFGIEKITRKKIED